MNILNIFGKKEEQKEWDEQYFEDQVKDVLKNKKSKYDYPEDKRPLHVIAREGRNGTKRRN